MDLIGPITFIIWILPTIIWINPLHDKRANESQDKLQGNCVRETFYQTPVVHFIINMNTHHQFYIAVTKSNCPLSLAFPKHWKCGMYS